MAGTSDDSFSLTSRLGSFLPVFGGFFFAASSDFLALAIFHQFNFSKIQANFGQLGAKISVTLRNLRNLRTEKNTQWNKEALIKVHSR